MWRWPGSTASSAAHAGWGAAQGTWEVDGGTSSGSYSWRMVAGSEQRLAERAELRCFAWGHMPAHTRMCSCACAAVHVQLCMCFTSHRAYRGRTRGCRRGRWEALGQSDQGGGSTALARRSCLLCRVAASETHTNSTSDTTHGTTAPTTAKELGVSTCDGLWDKWGVPPDSCVRHGSAAAEVYVPLAHAQTRTVIAVKQPLECVAIVPAAKRSGHALTMRGTARQSLSVNS